MFKGGGQTQEYITNKPQKNRNILRSVDNTS